MDRYRMASHDALDLLLNSDFNITVCLGTCKETEGLHKGFIKINTPGSNTLS